MNPLRPYQTEGVKWLVNKRVAYLADEMGLGKTAQVVKAADAVNAESILIICPGIARENWQREFDKWSDRGRKFVEVYSGKDIRNAGPLTIISYDLIEKFGRMAAALDLRWDLMVCDEAHYLKSHTAKRTKWVLGNKDALAKRATRRWLISGTPAPNHAAELWPTLFACGKTKLSYTEFVRKFCDYYQVTKWVLNVTGTRRTAIPELKQLLKGFMLRRLKKDVATDLPPITFNHIFVEPKVKNPEDLDFENPNLIQHIYPIDRRKEWGDKVRSEERAITEYIETLGARSQNAAMGIEALSRNVPALRHFLAHQKVDAVADVIEKDLENNAYHKVVIFGIHQAMIDGLRHRLSRFHPVTLYGKTPARKRQTRIDKFQNQDHCRVFIGNIQACGTAVTLTAAHHVVFAEQDWVPGNNAQALMRCHRIGQMNRVYVRFFGVRGSIDEKVTTVLKRKARELCEIFDE